MFRVCGTVRDRDVFGVAGALGGHGQDFLSVGGMFYKRKTQLHRIAAVPSDACFGKGLKRLASIPPSEGTSPWEV